MRCSDRDSGVLCPAALPWVCQIPLILRVWERFFAGVAVWAVCLSGWHYDRWQYGPW